MDGVLVIDKPVGPTSHDVVARVRRFLGEPRVGHTGTLDPNASGVLPLVLGKATRLSRFLTARDKDYDALIELGVSTDSGDAAGRALGSAHSGPMPPLEVVDAALDAFRGSFLQQPPAFSAKKIDGQRSYRIARAAARAGAPISVGAADADQTRAASAPARHPQPVPVTVHALAVLGFEAGRLRLRVHCSAGFYVRSLAHDLGTRLGTGAHLAGLRRTRSGDFRMDDAVPLEAVEQDVSVAARRLVPLDSLLPGFAGVSLTDEGLRHARHGRPLSPADVAAELSSVPAEKGHAPNEPDTVETWIRLLGPDGGLIGLARRQPSSGLLHPSVVLI
jgi:tRNA pseudouridine55 synthase